MQAIIATKYGSPEVLSLVQIKKPEPLTNQVLIKVHAAVVGPADCAFRAGKPFIIKLLYGLKRPKFPIGGVELAGEIVALGEQVKNFKIGDQIYGISPDTFGAHAEYLCLPETALVSTKPTNLSYAESVAIIDGGLTSLVFLRDKAKLKPGQRILINGASGSVGGYAVQLAKYFGAHVTGVCSTSNVELVKSLGADEVIDYTKQDFTDATATYDVVFDAVSKSSFDDAKRVLTKNGIYMATVPTIAIVMQMWWSAWFSSQRALFAATGLQQKKANIDFLTELAETGKLKPTIDREYPLAQIAQAHSYVGQGHKKGNVVISVA